MQQKAELVVLLLFSVVATAMSACEQTELISGSRYRVRDSSLYATSQYGQRGPAKSRLHTKDENGKSSAWCAATCNTEQFIQVHFARQMLVTAVGTQGGYLRHPEWITSYQLQYRNGTSWQFYQENYSNIKTFSGNSNQDSLVTHKLKEPFLATIVRLYPRTWHNWICLRLELYGCDYSACHRAPILTGSSSNVADCQLTASSEYSTGLAQYSRLNSAAGYGGWRPTTFDQDQWIQVDLKTKWIILAVVTYGHAQYSGMYSKIGYVSSYYVRYSVDGYTWATYTEHSDPVLFMPGDRSGYRYLMRSPFIARYVRLNPRTWHGMIILQWEIDGCLM